MLQIGVRYARAVLAQDEETERHFDVVPSFTPDGTHLLAGYETGDAYLWDIRPASLIRHACRTAGRRLTRAEWQELLPGRDYDPAC
jgi:hypothetical protein